MKDQNQNDKGTRKSNRQRVPNSFYIEGINQLKKAPRPARQIQPKQSRKRSILYQQDGQNSDEQMVQEDRSDLMRQSLDWFPCKLPKNGQLMKVQFVIQQIDQSIPEKKKEEPSKTAKKNGSTFDLLSLFQKAIENVNDQVVVQKYIEQEIIIKQPKIRKEYSMTKQRKAEDIEGKITHVSIQSDKVIFKQTKIGETEIPMMSLEKMETEEGMNSQIEDYRQRLNKSNILSQISIFN